MKAIIVLVLISISFSDEQSVEYLSPNQRLFVNGVPIDPNGAQSDDQSVFLVRGQETSDKDSDDSPIEMTEPDLRRAPIEDKPKAEDFASINLLDSFKEFGKEKNKEKEIKPIVDQMEKDLKDWKQKTKIKEFKTNQTSTTETSSASSSTEESEDQSTKATTDSSSEKEEEKTTEEDSGKETTSGDTSDE